jgi:phosphohistidine phosphatase
VEGLAPTDDPEKARIQVEAACEPLMLVGHLPHLSRLASSLLVGDPAKEIIRFRNGAIVSLVKADRGWLLQWILTPALASVQPAASA